MCASLSFYTIAHIIWVLAMRSPVTLRYGGAELGSHICHQQSRYSQFVVLMMPLQDLVPPLLVHPPQGHATAHPGRGPILSGLLVVHATPKLVVRQFPVLDHAVADDTDDRLDQTARDKLAKTRGTANARVDAVFNE